MECKIFFKIGKSFHLKFNELIVHMLSSSNKILKSSLITYKQSIYSKRSYRFSLINKFYSTKTNFKNLIITERIRMLSIYYI